MVATLAVVGSVGTFGLMQSIGSADAAAPPAPRVNVTDAQPGTPNPGYDPAEITVKVGQAVVWHNSGKEAHTVTADDKSFDSGDKAANQDWQYSFAKAGTFAYHCTPHPWMKGTVKVTP
jgi:plastocyanin